MTEANFFFLLFGLWMAGACILYYMPRETLFQRPAQWKVRLYVVLAILWMISTIYLCITAIQMTLVFAGAK